MIKLVLLTGFLGSGKTTMMQEILTSYKDAKTGVIVNEFGSVNIDGKLLERDGIQMSELSNGSIFCACIKDKFVDSLIEMSAKDIDYLFIEASGLADPANMEEILEGIKPNLVKPYDYRGSICVIDGTSFLELYEVLTAVTSQLEFCGAVVINKIDLIDEETLSEIEEIVSEINSNAELYVTSYCKVDTRKIVDNIKINRATARETSNTVESRPITFIIKGLDTIPSDKLETFINDIAADTYRIKGFAKTDKGNVEISGVCKNITISPWKEEVENTEIVVISAVGVKMMSVLTSNIAKSLKGYVRL